jgi:hypothetical protein
MKRKSILFLFFIFITLGTVFSQSYTPIYVAAPNGLSLRENADQSSKKLDLIPYGTKLDPISYAQLYVNIDGHRNQWIKISHNKKQGYIFGGYTLPFPVPQNNKHKDVMDYLNNIFGSPLLFDSISPPAIDGNFTYYHYTAYYRNAVIYTYAPGYEQHDCSIINNELTIEQAYLFMCLLDRSFDLTDSRYSNEKVELNTSFPEKNTAYWKYTIALDPNGGISINTEHYYIKVFYLNGNTAISWGGGV